MASLLLLLALPAHADIISEFGMGVKVSTTSYVMRPECHTVYSYPPGDRPEAGFLRSCGGDNPTFVGWPLAYEWTSPSGRYRLRGGWFHYSNWFDGGRRRETHMDCLCGSLTIRWRRRN